MLPLKGLGQLLKTYCVQRGSSSHVRQKSYFQNMEQEILVVNAIYSVQEEHHWSLVIWYKTSRHLWFDDAVI